MDDKPYADFGVFLKKYFRGKVQKISINAGFTCPNRDGTKGNGGCTYCNNQTFSPDIAIPTSLLPNSCKKESVFSDASIPTWNI